MTNRDRIALTVAAHILDRLGYPQLADQLRAITHEDP